MKKERYFKVRAVKKSNAGLYDKGDEFIVTGVKELPLDYVVFKDYNGYHSFYKASNFKTLFQCDREGNNIENIGGGENMYKTSTSGISLHRENKPTMKVVHTSGDVYKVYKEVVVKGTGMYYKEVGATFPTFINVNCCKPYIKPSYSLSDLKRIVEEERGEFTYLG